MQIATETHGAWGPQGLKLIREIGMKIREATHEKKVIFSDTKNSYSYSGVPNKRVGWNKHVGRKFSQKLINVLFLINMLVGKFEVSINAN